MGILNLDIDRVKPSDVFGYEVNTDEGYGRDSYALTLATGKQARVGTILVVDQEEKTATLLAAPADAAAVEALGDLVVFVGKDLPPNGSNFDRLLASQAGDGSPVKVTAIIRGDGRGTLKKGYLDLDGTPFYSLPADVQKALSAKLTKENRFKMVEQQVPEL